MAKAEILVTGSTGLVGAHLLYYLTSQGNQVKALVRSKSGVSKVRKVFEFYTQVADILISKIEWVEGDIEDYYSLLDITKDIKYVYHTAAIVSLSPFDREEIFKTNIKGTANVVNACIENKISKLCYVSSVAALGRTDDGSFVTEQTHWRPSKNASAYSISKFNAETEVWRAVEEGLSAVIVNPSVILGPGDWSRGSSSMIASIYDGLKYYTAGTTGYVDVRDVCKIMIHLMNSNINGERFLLNSENYLFKDAFIKMTQALGLKRTLTQVKPWMLQVAWRWEYLKYYLFRISPRITKSVVRSGKNRTLYSNKKISDTLCYHFIPVEESIKHLADCFMKDKGRM